MTTKDNTVQDGGKASNPYSYTTDANSAIDIRLVWNTEDTHKEPFHPEYTHQIVDDESQLIYGYKDLKISLLFAAGSLFSCLNIQHSEKIDPPKDIKQLLLQKMSSKFPPESNTDVFLQDLEEREANFTPPGQQIASYTLTSPNTNPSPDTTISYEVYVGGITERGINELHERAEIFVMLYIDAASYIESDDDKWLAFLIFEKRQKPDGVRYGFVGYSTLYKFYRYPDFTRLRISQFLILPPYRRLGHGQKLLSATYEYAKTQGAIADVTVEDPSLDFQYLRDKVDMSVILKNEYFKGVPLGDSSKYSIIQKQLKLDKQQIRRCHEIYTLMNLNGKNPVEVTAFRLSVKRRLYKKYVTGAVDPDEKKETLHDFFNELEEEYRNVINRLPAK